MADLFRPIMAGAHFRERALACLGATLGIALTIAICAALPIAAGDLPVIVAPLGASAVLAFAVPASPLAQPWPLIGGNVVSALVGVAAAMAIPHLALSAGVAVGGAILVMSLMRCLHPPGGAAALTAVIGGEGVRAAGFGFALVPVGVNSLALAALAIAFHRLAGRSYPHRAAPVPPAFHADDIDAALEEVGESFDIAREDLDALLASAERHAARRTPGRGR